MVGDSSKDEAGTLTKDDVMVIRGKLDQLDIRQMASIKNTSELSKDLQEFKFSLQKKPKGEDEEGEDEDDELNEASVSDLQEKVKELQKEVQKLRQEMMRNNRELDQKIALKPE